MIPLSVPEISGNEWKYVKDCLDTGWVSSVGGYVDLFEEKFREFVGSESAVVTMNGTSALTLAFQTLGIGYGDEVIVPSMTFIASVNPIVYVGAKPVFADITEDTWALDVKKIENLITNRTKAILPVHVYGNMTDMEPLLEIARRNGLFVIEDATEALGSEYKTSDGVWHKAGTMGHFGAFSFNGNKLITTGAGGMLVSNDTQLGQKAKYLSNQAKTPLDNGGMLHEEIGYNYRMPNLIAAMGVAQLERASEFIAKKARIAEIYKNMLYEMPGIGLAGEKENMRTVKWLYSALVSTGSKIGRDALIKELRKKDIMSRPFFEPIHKMKPYRDYRADSIGVTERISQEGINLPSSVGLTEDELIYVCECIRGSLT